MPYPLVFLVLSLAAASAALAAEPEPAADKPPAELRDLFEAYKRGISERTK